MDVQMPVMDGYEATKQIRQWEDKIYHEMPQDLSKKRKKIPIVALTAHAITGYRDRCIEVGMDDYLSKPLRREELMDMVDKWIRKNEAQDEHSSSGENRLPIDSAESAVPAEDISCPIDLKKAMDEFDSDMEFVKETLRGFLTNVRKQLEIIHTAIRTGDTETVRKEAHSIKGGAANICADDLSQAALNMESLGKSGSVDNGQEIFQKLEKEFCRLLEYHAAQNN
jgi:CheY-like chemotaxis protein